MTRENFNNIVKIAVLVGIGSQFSFQALTSGFIITLAVVILGIGLYLYQDINPLCLIWTVAVWSPLFRTIVEGISQKNWDLVLTMTYPDVFFYFSYGVVFYIIYNGHRKKNMLKFLIAIGCSDCLANCVEMMVRLNKITIGIEYFNKLAQIAIIRVLIVWLVILFIKSYKRLLLDEQHEERYKKLMVMASVFNSEVYFMNKNIVEIEDVMKKAFALYKRMPEDIDGKENKRLALDIAKDVHEIKKDYIRVIQGLQENFLAEIKTSPMKMSDIIKILDSDIRDRIKEIGRNIYFKVDIKSDFTVSNHFSMMSILRNLVMNSLEAIGGESEGIIDLTVSEIGECYVITVYDNGPGIRNIEMDVIFAPGFSTKFDDCTGDISRGVGLTLVKSLVEDIFSGTISVDSKEYKYTKFEVILPIDKLE